MLNNKICHKKIAKIFHFFWNPASPLHFFLSHNLLLTEFRNYTAYKFPCLLSIWFPPETSSVAEYPYFFPKKSAKEAFLRWKVSTLNLFFWLGSNFSPTSAMWRPLQKNGAAATFYTNLFLSFLLLSSHECLFLNGKFLETAMIFFIKRQPQTFIDRCEMNESWMCVWTLEIIIWSQKKSRESGVKFCVKKIIGKVFPIIFCVNSNCVNSAFFEKIRKFLNIFFQKYVYMLKLF